MKNFKNNVDITLVDGNFSDSRLAKVLSHPKMKDGAKLLALLNNPKGHAQYVTKMVATTLKRNATLLYKTDNNKVPEGYAVAWDNAVQDTTYVLVLGTTAGQRKAYVEVMGIMTESSARKKKYAEQKQLAATKPTDPDDAPDGGGNILPTVSADADNSEEFILVAEAWRGRGYTVDDSNQVVYAKHGTLNWRIKYELGEGAIRDTLQSYHKRELPSSGNWSDLFPTNSRFPGIHDNDVWEILNLGHVLENNMYLDKNGFEGIKLDSLINPTEIVTLHVEGATDNLIEWLSKLGYKDAYDYDEGADEMFINLPTDKN